MSMEIFTPFFQAVIAFCAFFSFQFGLIYFLLDAKINPLKKDIAKLEDRQANLENRQAKLENGQANLERGQAKLEAKLDQLLAKSS